MAGRGPDEGLGRLAHLDRGEVKARPSGFPEERPERRAATSGAPGGARAGNGTRHLSKVPDQDVAPNGAPLPLWREEGNEGGAPRLATSGADESRLHECRRGALKGAGCLTCESENAPAWAVPTAVIPGRSRQRANPESSGEFGAGVWIPGSLISSAPR